jgi:dihydroxyacetone kinase-like protein
VSATTDARLARGWLERAADLVAAHAVELTDLDRAIGDGDHGINLDRGFARVRDRLLSGEGLADPESASASDVLRLAGQILVSTVGGAAGPLYGTFFIQLSAELSDPATVNPTGLGQGLHAAAEALARRGRSTVGEKTMLDALVPASLAWQRAAAAGGTLEACARAAHRAADDGRAATGPMIATKGRASYLGERSIGHVDPGAASAALLLRALADAVAQDGAGPDPRR